MYWLVKGFSNSAISTNCFIIEVLLNKQFSSQSEAVLFFFCSIVGSQLLASGLSRLRLHFTSSIFYLEQINEEFCVPWCYNCSQLWVHFGTFQINKDMKSRFFFFHSTAWVSLFYDFPWGAPCRILHSACSGHSVGWIKMPLTYSMAHVLHVASCWLNRNWICHYSTIQRVCRSPWVSTTSWWNVESIVCHIVLKTNSSRLLK